jgi:hypothetical protein
MANFDASMGVKTGSEHRTDEFEAKEKGTQNSKPQTRSAPANKLGEFPRHPRSGSASG